MTDHLGYCPSCGGKSVRYGSEKVCDGCGWAEDNRGGL